MSLSEDTISDLNPPLHDCFSQLFPEKGDVVNWRLPESELLNYGKTCRSSRQVRSRGNFEKTVLNGYVHVKRLNLTSRMAFFLPGAGYSCFTLILKTSVF